MTVLIEHWKKYQLPAKDGLYYADGRSFEINLTWGNYNLERIAINEEFSLDALLINEKIEWTDIDGLGRLSLPNGAELWYGEGSHGSEGFIAKLKDNENIEWAFSFEDSNPFINCIYDGVKIVKIKSSSNFWLVFDVNDPSTLSVESETAHR